MTNLKTLFKEATELKERMKSCTGDSINSLTNALYERGEAHNLKRSELIVLLQEALYLLLTKSPTAEEELMESVKYWHPELF